MRTALILRPAPQDEHDLTGVVDLLFASGNDRQPLVLPNLPETAAKDVVRPVTILRIACNRGLQDIMIGRILTELTPNCVITIDAWPEPTELSNTLRNISRQLFSTSVLPAACLVFAPSSERFYASEELANAFYLRSRSTDAFGRNLAHALAAAHLLRWLGPVGLHMYRLIARNFARVYRLFTR